MYVKNINIDCFYYANICILSFKQKKFKHMKAAIECFHKFGYGIVPNFISEGACLSAIKQIDSLIQHYQPSPQQLFVFQSIRNEKATNKYFLDSADKVRFFLEKQAYKDGKLTVPKLNSINKIGHALHQHNKIFQMITYQKKVKEICEQCGIQDPVVVQSMAILKPPKIGGQVNIHQDSSFLYDQPLSLVGFWIPLQDATVKNGCLWGLPGSHHGKLYSRVKMNKDLTKMQSQKLHEVDYEEKDFIPLEMKKGSLAFFTGKFLHKSESNRSQKSRYAYTWHLKRGDTKWAESNWLQRQKFPSVKFEHDQV